MKKAQWNGGQREVGIGGQGDNWVGRHGGIRREGREHVSGGGT